MHRIASSVTLGFLLALAGCAGDDSPPTTGSADSSAGSADSTTNGTDPDPTTTNSSLDTTAGPSTDPDPTTGEPDPTTGEPDPTTGGPDPTTGEPDPTSGGMSMACDPDPMDDMCAECVKMNCCPQLETCLADGDSTTGCTCFQECVQAGGDPLMRCNQMCGVNPLDPGTPTGQIGGCTVQNCGVGICL